MNERIEARMQQKHASAQMWEQTPNFVPEAGEIVIYDKDSNDESVIKPRIKVGDGITRIQDLKFIVGELYVQNEQPPEDAGEGAVWISFD